MKPLRFLPLPLLLATALIGQQTQLVRGKVEDNANTFFLSCTSIPLVSATLNLRTMVGLQWDLRVVNIGSSTNPRLDVISAVQANKIFDMGNLRIDRADRWEVLGPPGAIAAAWITATDLTGYSPLGDSGTWLLGSPFVLVNSGTISALGRFEFTLQPPNLPHLIGVFFTAQGAYGTQQGQLVITNPDCRDLRAN